MIKVEEPSRKHKTWWIEADAKTLEEYEKFYKQSNEQLLFKVPNKLLEDVKKKYNYDEDDMNDKENG